MISQTAEYALRAASYLALAPDEARTTQQIAEATKVPPGYLAKVLKELARAGIVSSQRGLYGGFHLARDPDELTVLEVVQAVAPVQRIRECPLGLREHVNLCPLHRVLDDALAEVERALGAVTLGMLCTSTKKGGPLCDTKAQPVQVRVSRNAAGNGAGAKKPSAKKKIRPTKRGR